MEIRHFDDLKRIRDDKTEETTSLEFKLCSELVIGTEFWQKGEKRNQKRDDVFDELTRDVFAFLNSAGGTIIYGIREKKSGADELDTLNAFNRSTKQENITPEKVVDWLRAHILPPPQVNVKSIPIEGSDLDSPWFLVIEIPQGKTAFQAKNKVFYRRVSSTVQPREQYDVHDAVNIAQIPEADVDIGYSSTNPLSQFQHEYELATVVKSLSDIVIKDFKLEILISVFLT